jgi:hypothetical protein
VVTQIVEVDPLELAAALARDAPPEETILQPTRGTGVVRRKSTASRMEIIREGWQHWVILNAMKYLVPPIVIPVLLFIGIAAYGMLRPPIIVGHAPAPAASAQPR